MNNASAEKVIKLNLVLEKETELLRGIHCIIFRNSCRSLLVFGLLLLSVIPFVSLSQDPISSEQKTLEKFDRVIKKSNLPALSIAFVNNQGPPVLMAVGVKTTKDKKNQIDTLTIFEAASLTKPLVAYCAMRMVENNILELDTPLYKYLEYDDLSHDNRYKRITARLVLSHSSGLPNWRSDRSSDTLNIRFEPGSRFGYSGEGFVYLQKVMEHLMNNDLNGIMDEYLFSPLEMTRSSLIFNYADNYAVGHNGRNKPQPKFKPQYPNAAYSLHTTAGDYMKFLQELTDPKYLSPEHAALMTTAVHPMKNDDRTIAWGLGVGLNFTETEKYIWHWGDNGIFKAFFIISADTGMGFVYFCNSEKGLGIVRQLTGLFFSDEHVLENWHDYEQF